MTNDDTDPQDTAEPSEHELARHYGQEAPSGPIDTDPEPDPEDWAC